MQLFVYTSLLSLGSKKPLVLYKDVFFDNFTFMPDDIYSALSHFSKISEELHWHLNRLVTMQYKRRIGQAELMPDHSDEYSLEIYRGLRHLEESHKSTKSTHEAFSLICFISILVAGITELRLGGKYTIAEITETLRKVSCSKIDQNLWLFDFANEVTDDMNAAFGTDFGRKIMTLDEIKKSLGSAKKAAHH